MAQQQLKTSLNLLDGILLVVGSMVGSGIFIVSADIAGALGSAGWLIAVWALAGFITLTAAVSYGELSGMYPQAGGQYVYLREAFGKRIGFLYGWAFFAVIQTGTIAAVGVGFGKFLGYLNPNWGDKHLLFGTADTFHISAAQIVGIIIILFLTFINTLGVKSGKWIQLLFTMAKVTAMAALIVYGLAYAAPSLSDNWQSAWFAMKISQNDGMIHHESYASMSELILAVGTAMVGALFSSDAWNSVTFIAGELKNPQKNIGLSLFLGTVIVTLLYVVMNLMYLHTLSISEIAFAPDSRVATAVASKIMGADGAKLIAILIMLSTFGCNNGLILSGARVYYTMAKDGLFLQAASRLNKNDVPQAALWMQGLWAAGLCLSGQYGNLLNYIVFTVLVFYILTIAGIFKLRQSAPMLPRPYKAWGYPVLPAVYIVLAGAICVILLITQTLYSGAGLLIVLLGLPIYYLSQHKNSTIIENE